MEHLELEGYIRIDPTHGGVLLTNKSADVLFRGESVMMTTITSLAAEKRSRKKEHDIGDEMKKDLFATLKALRYKLAQEEKIPAYIIFSNAALADMATKAPKNMEEFLNVSGVGEIKASRYGKAFLEEIKKYSDGDNRWICLTQRKNYVSDSSKTIHWNAVNLLQEHGCRYINWVFTI